MRGTVQRQEEVAHSLVEDVEVAHLQHQQVERHTLRDQVTEHRNRQKVCFCRVLIVCKLVVRLVDIKKRAG